MVLVVSSLPPISLMNDFHNDVPAWRMCATLIILLHPKITLVIDW